ncbi:tetratricopeptide repeat protein [Nitrospinae bacterium AH_259_B05_G02_I21]|nr:tetratricopeptide repeat protein [Nitrospinae bacterium AH_259_B05_G02_I21]
MRRSKRWVSVSALTAILMVVLGLSMCSVASAQEVGWEALTNRALALSRQGKYREAIPVAKEALKVAEQTFGPNHPNVAQSLNSLALLYKVLGQYAKAEPLYKRALAIRERALRLIDGAPQWFACSIGGPVP